MLTDNIRQTVNFYTTNPLFQIDHQYSHFASLSTGNAKLHIPDRHAVTPHLPEMQYPQIGGTMMLYFTIEDIETYYETVQNNTPIHIELHETAYHSREFCIKDNNGYFIDFGELIA